MTNLSKTCKNCKQSFVLDEKDLAFLKKVGPTVGGHKFEVPTPAFCPDCRQQRRLTFRNERKLYKNTCAFSGKNIISIYSPDKPYKVYANDIWWSDKWDPCDYGRDYDFSRPFFEQFADLKKEVPCLPLLSKNSENSEYTHLETDSKNCYMNFGGHFNEDSHYNLHLFYGRDTLDCYWSDKAELCYSCFKCFNAYSLIYCYWCFNCSESAFCYDCKGCSNCFGCTGLRQKKYCYFNKQLTAEEYEKKMKEVELTPDMTDFYLEESKALWNKMPHRNLVIENSENSLGDLIKNCKNCEYIFETDDSEDCRYCDVAGLGMKDSFDITRAGYEMELCYEVMAGTFLNRTLFSNFFFDHNNDSMYIDNCFSNDHLFGCTNMHNKRYCILNKQYTKEEWEELLPRIIEHMMETGEWGEFFPSSLSPFAYNETLALDYFPLTKEEALAQGFKWKDPDPQEFSEQKVKVPASIKDTDESILQEVLSCGECGKNYRIMKEEFLFYKKMGLPVPLKCPDCRMSNLLKWRNPHKFWDRSCERCKTGLKSVYSPDRPERIFCEDCYKEALV
ncbi:hypothetical protein GF354_02735 [Candidatus Peregrinibacteria bacterium]|nr:hypothetical protein [Candidatus Peregrinibacteria bacterium]